MISKEPKWQLEKNPDIFVYTWSCVVCDKKFIIKKKQLFKKTIILTYY